MLVLSRKMGERIHIGDDIVLEVRRIAGNRVTLALDAPKHVRILRGELESPAREFRAPPDEAQRAPRPFAGQGVKVIGTLAAQPVGHDCVT